jgi:hypothetical protein
VGHHVPHEKEEEEEESQRLGHQPQSLRGLKSSEKVHFPSFLMSKNVVKISVGSL